VLDAIQTLEHMQIIFPASMKKLFDEKNEEEKLKFEVESYIVPGRLTHDKKLDWFDADQLAFSNSFLSLAGLSMDKLVLQFSMNVSTLNLPHGLMNSLISELRHLIYFMHPYFPSDSDSLQYSLSVNRNRFSIRPVLNRLISSKLAVKEGMHIRVTFDPSMLKSFSVEVILVQSTNMIKSQLAMRDGLLLILASIVKFIDQSKLRIQMLCSGCVYEERRRLVDANPSSSYQYLSDALPILQENKQACALMTCDYSKDLNESFFSFNSNFDL